MYYKICKQFIVQIIQINIQEDLFGVKFFCLQEQKELHFNKEGSSDFTLSSW